MAVLNSLLFCYKNILHAPKAPKALRCNQAKAQNATSKQKLKMCLKTSKGKKLLIRLFAFLCFLCT